MSSVLAYNSDSFPLIMSHLQIPIELGTANNGPVISNELICVSYYCMGAVKSIVKCVVGLYFPKFIISPSICILTSLFGFFLLLHQLVVNSTKIVDFPRFPHRGFLIDTSRHFVHVKYIFQMIVSITLLFYKIFILASFHILSQAFEVAQLILIS